LKGSGDGEEDQEDGDDNVLRNEEHEVTKDPRESNGDVDGHVDSQLLLSVSLVRLGGARKCLVDLSSDEEEEDSVGGDDEESGDEEGQETSQVVQDPALSSVSVCDGTIFYCSTNTNTESQRESPTEEMVPLLEELRLSVSSHDHLVEIEGDAECPAEVCNEEEVHQNGH